MALDNRAVYRNPFAGPHAYQIAHRDLLDTQFRFKAIANICVVPCCGIVKRKGPKRSQCAFDSRDSLASILVLSRSVQELSPNDGTRDNLHRWSSSQSFLNR